MKTLPSLVCAAALALTLSACSLGSSGSDAAQTVKRVPELKADQKVSLIFESYNFGQAGAWTDTFNELIAEFEKAHPNITVKAQKPQGNSSNPATDAVSSVQSQLVAGHAPDVAQLGFGDLDFAVNQLKAKPLDDLVGKDTVQKNFDGTKYPYVSTARTLGDWNGKTYGVPFVLSTPVLYYNATLFKKAGLDPSKPPTTWAEVQKDALIIKAKTHSDGVYADCLTKAAKDWCFQSLVRSNGGTVLSSDHDTLTYADQPAVEVAKTFQKMVTEGATPKLTQTQAVADFARGDLGMMLESSSLQGQFLKASKGTWDLRASTMPAFGTKTVVPTNSGAALFVFSSDPAKQRAAWDLITFLTSESSYTTITSKIGYLPLRTGLTAEPALAAWIKKYPLVQPNLTQLSTMQPWVSFPGKDYLTIRDGMMDAVEDVVYQGADAAGTLKAAQTRGAALVPTS